MVPSGRLPRSTSRIIGLSISPQTLLLGEIFSPDQLVLGANLQPLPGPNRDPCPAL
jgi:hypothetical protein